MGVKVHPQLQKEVLLLFFSEMMKFFALTLVFGCVVAQVSAAQRSEVSSDRKSLGGCPTNCENGCCPYSNATCCSDGRHCCPPGTTCDSNPEWCNPASNSKHQERKLEQFQTHTDDKVLTVAEYIKCPDGTNCPLNYFCCNYFAVEYTCCPSGTVCCVQSDVPQCCPNGYVCKGKQCTKPC